MDIYTLVGNFWAEDQRAHLSASATRLYFFLLHEANRKY
ncbi:Crp/Fnr family transcriptional regulator, partial [Candidatus Bathyarchaeota archaeon]